MTRRGKRLALAGVVLGTVAAIGHVKARADEPPMAANARPAPEIARAPAPRLRCLCEDDGLAGAPEETDPRAPRVIRVISSHIPADVAPPPPPPEIVAVVRARGQGGGGVMRPPPRRGMPPDRP